MLLPRNESIDVHVPTGALGIWRRALSFHMRQWRELAVVLPLLLVPVVGDGLQTILIAQDLRTGVLDVPRAVREVLRAWWPLLRIKVAFELEAMLWSLIPIYGVFRAMRGRLFWAMASNVLVFEGLRGEEGRTRCRELVADNDARLMLRTLTVVPALLFVAAVVVWVCVVTFFEWGRPALWAFVAVAVWILGPAAGAVNTMLYLALVGDDAETRASEPRTVASLGA